MRAKRKKKNGLPIRNPKSVEGVRLELSGMNRSDVAKAIRFLCATGQVERYSFSGSWFYDVMFMVGVVAAAAMITLTIWGR